MKFLRILDFLVSNINLAHVLGVFAMHAVIWGGLCPELLARISTFPDLCQEAEKVLDSMYCASLPREVHVRDLVNKTLPLYYNASNTFGNRKRKRAGRAMLVMPDPLNEAQRFNSFTHACVCQTGIHTHCFTCMKPPNGYTGCRLCKPSGDIDRTKPVQLIDTSSNEQQMARKKIKVSYEISDPLPCQIKEGNIGKDSIEDDVSIPDSRLIVWEIKRPLLQPLPQPSLDEERNVKWHTSQLEREIIGDNGADNPNVLEEDLHYINELVADIKGMKEEDLQNMYNQISSDLVNRNGMVADYNPILTSLMGCNTNSLFLGSKEQSKGALFYIGPYICKYVRTGGHAFHRLRAYGIQLHTSYI